MAALPGKLSLSLGQTLKTSATASSNFHSRARFNFHPVFVRSRVDREVSPFDQLIFAEAAVVDVVMPAAKAPDQPGDVGMQVHLHLALGPGPFDGIKFLRAAARNELGRDFVLQEGVEQDGAPAVFE